MSNRSSIIRDAFKDPLIVAFRRDNSIWDVVVYEKNNNKTIRSIRESPSNCPFMKINGNEAPEQNKLYFESHCAFYVCTRQR